KDAEWKGILPYTELAQFANPASGLIVQCNNSVYSSAQPPPLDPAKYPPYVAPPRLDATPGTRAARAYEILNPKSKITWEDHRAAGLDVHAITAAPLVRLLLKALEGEAASD